MANQIVELIDKAQDRFLSIAPQGMAFEAEKGFAVQLLSNNNHLAEAALQNPASLIQAITNVAAIGLSLNPAEKLAYLLPRNVKVDGVWQTRVFLEPSYMGMIRLATDSGSIQWIQAVLVHEADVFIDNGPGEKPTHQYKAFKEKERGPIVGVYALAKTKEGDYLTSVIPIDEINAIRDRSESWKQHLKSGKTSPWLTDHGEQTKKTAIRRLYKTLPRSNMYRLALAVDLSNQNEGFDPILTSPEIPDFNAEQKTYFDQLLTRQDAVGVYVMQQSVEPSVWTRLYHSFEKGTKGKYQRIIDELTIKGRNVIADWAAAVLADPSEAAALLEQLPADAVAIVAKQAPDIDAAIREAQRAAG